MGREGVASLEKGHGILRGGISGEDCFITGIDPRVKLVFCILFLGLAISARNVAVPLLILTLTLSGLVFLKISPGTFLVRGLPAVLIAAAILITQLFLYGKTPLFSMEILGMKVQGYREGLDRGLLMMCRVLAGISTVLLLTMSTSFDRLLFAAGWLRLPWAFLEVLTITYRYIHVILEEASSVKNAQKIRLGYSSLKKSVKSIGDLSGITVIRTFDKSERLYRSMKSRGYLGQAIRTRHNAVFMKRDWVATVCLALMTAAMALISF